MKRKGLALLGLAAKAGRLQSGEWAVDNTIKSARAFLVIIAGDASEKTKKHLQDMCNFRGIPAYIFSDRYELGKSIGKDMRVCIAVTDKGFSSKLISILQEDRE
ncbi:MAG: L7Ae/L30e/S12e/Gadd45 family ribosomal protein [Lachnospiraceae bacterium]